MAARDLKDDEILRFHREKITESAAGTFTQATGNTQLSVERGFIWLICFVEFYFQAPQLLDEVGAAGNELQQVQVTRESKSAIIDPSDTDMIAFQDIRLTRPAAIGTDAGPLWNFTMMPIRHQFNVPIPYAGREIFVGVKGTDAATAAIFDVRIGYTIKEVSDKFFFRVAQALVG